MHERTAKLHELMQRYKVDATVVAELLNREVNTIRVWRVEDTKRPIPKDTLQLLEAVLAARAAAMGVVAKQAAVAKKAAGKR